MNDCTMNRRDFVKGGIATASTMAVRQAWAQKHAPTGDGDLDARQGEIDAITPEDFKEYWTPGLQIAPDRLSAIVARFPVLGRLEAAFEKVFREVRDTTVTDIDRPAIWYMYNMGLVVKTPNTLFSIDLHHRRAEEFAPALDFALITHNHNDHYTERFKFAMDRVQHKPVVNNFFDNYGVKDRKLGGYTRARQKTFQYGDVKIITGLCDHNSYLIDYTTPFEVQIGRFTLFHSGDCCSHAKLHVGRSPDMWVFHPRCGMDVVKGCKEAIRPKLAVIAHLQEMGHAKGRYRWTYRDGLDEKARLEAAGFTARMPLWGERLA
ncbi:MAG: MBL fold metallo-hydrolase [Kiritimatiellae bacterium]|nr:MBL fold metallo-hydrolase [Kiritimatiellia bacterium]